MTGASAWATAKTSRACGSFEYWLRELNDPTPAEQRNNQGDDDHRQAIAL